MKYRLLLIAILLVSSTSVFCQSDFYEKNWSKVYQFEIKGLPKSALEATDTIYRRARREKNIEQFTKALLYQSKFALTLDKDAEVQIVVRLKKESAASTAPQKNILESIIAKIYWEYFQQNRWKYHQRSRTEAIVNPDDFRTWDSPTMFEEIHRHFQLSLQDEAVLMKTSLASIKELIVEATNSQLYRPTVYDLLAYTAIDFYQTDEYSLTLGINRFVLKDTAYFSSFESMKLPEADTFSLQLNALKLYQKLLHFHKNRDTTAYVDAELQRLAFLIKAGNIEDDNRHYKNALRKVSKENEHHPSSALADFEFASLLFREGMDYRPEKGHHPESQFRKKEALAYCDKVIKAFPGSHGAEKCSILRSKILDHIISIHSEKFIPINKPSFVQVGYANAKSISFRAYPVSFDFYENFWQQNDSTMLARLQSIPVAAQWKIDLKDLQDYQEHNTEVTVPPLPGGTYLLFGEVTVVHPWSKKKIFAYDFVNVTDLAVIESEFRDNERLQVVDRNTGRPIPGATVELVAPSVGNSTGINKQLTTDKDGFVEIKGEAGYITNIKSTISYQNDRLVIEHYDMYPGYRDRDDEDQYDLSAHFFTDRSIYRPGQTVFFKGILLKIKNAKSSIVTNEWVKVILNDVNDEEVASLRLKTNAFGSVAGEFKLPATGLTGEYTIAAEEDDEDDLYLDANSFNEGEISFSVEEYKRPTFETSFKPVKQTFRPNDQVVVSGSADAFNGSKISRAKVSYRVKRTANFPYWDWRSPRYYGGNEEIAHGDTVTNNNGEFQIAFKAIPDEKVRKDQKPIFNYEVTADVTDINGETRSTTTTVKVAYHTLQISISGPSSVVRKETKFSVSSENINDQYIPSKGTITLYKLVGPSAPVRKRPWEAPDVPSMSEVEFKKLFPHDTYDDNSDVRSWKKGKALRTADFDTEKSKEFRFTPDATWLSGQYVAELSTSDPSGEKVIVEHYFSVVSTGKKDIGDNQLLVVETDKPSYTIGDQVHLKLGSASADLTVMVDIERDYEIVKTHVVHLEGTMKEVTIPVGENMRDGFAIHCSAIHYNDFINEKKMISVLVPDDHLEIETITFKDKLLPGAKQTWSFAIKGKDAEEREAEILASMYDASLDQFTPHEWTFNPKPRYQYYSYIRVSADRTFGQDRFMVQDVHNYFSSPSQNYDELDWFGFSITNNYYVRSEYNRRLYYETNPALPSQVKMVRNRKYADGIISGRVTDRNKEPLPGTSIIIRGKDIGTVADADGHYEINAQKGDTLEFTFVGYNSAAAVVGKKNGVDVILEEEIAALAEIVVIGYGEQKKSMVTGSISHVTFAVADTVAGEYYLSEALAGHAMGVQVVEASGNAKQIMIRGQSTINGDSKPLYVVDGVIVTNYKVTETDIDQIQILKGAEATAIYGSRAGNGVVVVTTKSGQKKLDEEMAKITARKNFNETAFFFPQLRTNEQGRVYFTFTMPESVTRWKMQLLAHTKNLEVGSKISQVITQKDLMVTPNAPRFLRIGDQIIFSTKITNLTTQSREGNIALQLTNAVTGQSIDALLGNNIRNQTFHVEGKSNTDVSWKLTIPAGIDAVQYKVVAKTGKFSDGEQNAMPVLSNRMLVTESMSMYVRSGQTKTYNLHKLASAATNSATLQHHEVTLEITSNPVWYAIQSMPYLMEFPHECAEQLFSRYYSNALASHLVNGNPKVKAVFDQWNSAGELVSNLEKNQELKSIVIQETPWLRDAQSETEQKKRIAMLFDLNQMSDQMNGVISKLENMQLANGGFPWFSGSDYPSRYITQHVACGAGHLRHLKVNGWENAGYRDMIKSAIIFLDSAIVDDHRKLLKEANLLRTKEGDLRAKKFLEEMHVYKEEVHYLYMRSFFEDIKLSTKVQAAIDYYTAQSGKFWKEQNLYSRTMTALIQYRSGNVTLASDILHSIKENAVMSDDMGMYWKENKPGWYWNEAPIETQALLIEAFTEIEPTNKILSPEDRTKSIDEMRIWLLKNKQTTQWKTTKATTEAIYALMLQGTDWTSIDKAVEVKVGGESIVPKSVEAGTGYFKKSWSAPEVKPSMSSVTLTHKGEGIAWGGMYWQYFEDLDKITGAETPLRLTKKVFVVHNTDKGEVLTEINKGTAVKIGDLVRIRIELKVNQAMEFLHMKDMRASGLEPVDVLSGYKWQDGLGYYQSTKDASTNFFFDSVREGVYVFEYDLRANNKGDFSNGITTIQSMYAPEFSSHSEGVRIKID